MVAVVVYGYGSVVVYGYGLVVLYGYGFGAVVVGDRGDDDGAVAALQLMTRTRNSKRLTLRPATRHDDATANSTKQNPKKIMQRLRLVRI